jgi:ferredoxin-NADP reductase
MSDAPEKPARNLRSARVERIFDHAPGIRSLFLRLAEGRALRFVPGQFISISIPLEDETRTRAYSIASGSEDAHVIEICFNRVPGGRGAAWLFERGVGDTLDFIGPFGTFTMERAPEVETVLIAEGTAIAPIRPMMHLAARAKEHAPTLLLYGAQSPEQLLYRAELERLAANDRDLRIESMVVPDADCAALYERLAEETQKRWVNGDNVRVRQFYICGVGKGVLRLRDLLRAAGYERRSVHYEQW